MDIISHEKKMDFEQIEKIIDNRIIEGKIYPQVGDWVVIFENDWVPASITKVYYNKTDVNNEEYPPPRAVMFEAGNHRYVLNDDKYIHYGLGFEPAAYWIKKEDVRKTQDWAIDTGIDPSRITRHEMNIYRETNKQNKYRKMIV